MFKLGSLNEVGRLVAMKKMAFVGLCLAQAIASPALADGWEVQHPPSSPNLRLIYKGKHQTSYLFECLATDVILTQFGVTDLFDLKANTKVGDTPGSTMTAGAALMALATSVNDVPNFRPAETAPNATRGWDMTIRFSKNDKALRAMAKAKIISVFTTGYTMAVALNEADSQKVKSFLSQCGVKI